MTSLPLFDDQYLTMKESAEILGVSNATVSNWVKLGVLSLPIGSRKKLLPKKSVIDLKEKILSGESEKLKSRANKAHVSKKRVHKEINDSHILGFLNYVDEIASDENYQSILLSLAKILVLHENRKTTHNSHPLWFDLCMEEVKAWENDVGEVADIDLIVPSDILDVLDILGKTYQHISESHSKAVGGVFYTPSHIAQKIIRENLKREDVVLDPCCGSGSFLIQALFEKIKHGDQNIYSYIYGYDIDPISVHICRLNLLLLGKDVFTSMPKIYLKDTLQESGVSGGHVLNFKVDLIATNPPWGATLSEKQRSISCASDSFALFLKLAIDSARVYGKLAMLLPESFVDVSAHSQIRKKILTECSDVVITKLGKAFKGMLTNVVLLEAKAGGNNANQRVILRTDNGVTTAAHEEILSNKFSEFVFDLDGLKFNLISKIYAFKHKRLGAESDYSLGIVTGNNPKMVLDKPGVGCEGVLKGKDIQPFKFTPPSNFIKFDKKSFQQCSDERYFRAKEKLIYRFISNKLIFSYDDQGTLTLNSANFIIPRLQMPVKVVLAILQSSVSQFLFESKFNSVKVLKRHLQELPIFEFDKCINDQLEELVNEILRSESKDCKANLIKINKIIYEQIGLNDEEIKMVESVYAKSS